MSDRPAISVVIANLNGEKYLVDCLKSLADQTFRNFEVILVDNGSTDSSVNLVRSNFPWVKMICLESNSGFARANNTGIRASSARYIATLNNDTIADPHWLSELHRVAEADQMVGMVASKIYLGTEGNELDSAGMLLYPDGMSRQNGRGEKDSGQFDAIREVLFPSACAALYRMEMLNETGCFDEDFFSYCEDTDLGLRARLAGWSAVLAPNAKIRHLYSQTSGRYSEFKAYHVERNHFWVLLKNLPFSFIMLFPFYTLWRYIIQAYGFATGQGSVARFAENSGLWKMLKLVLISYGAAFEKFFSMIRKRRYIWRARRIGRKEYRSMLKRHRITASELMLKD